MKLTKPQAALLARVKASGLMVRDLSPAERRVAAALEEMGLIARDGAISSRGPYNQAARNDQVLVAADELRPTPTNNPKGGDHG